MRWVLMLFVILAAVMGGEARAVVVMGRAEVSERVGGAETVEERAEALRVESERAILEVEEVAGLEDAGPLALRFPGGLAVARSDCGDRQAEFSGRTLSLLLARGVDIGGGTRGLLWTARRETGSAETGSTVTLRFNRYNSRGDVVGQSDAAGVTKWAATYQADGRRTGEIGTNLNPKHATGRVRELGVNRDRHRANSKEEDPTGLLNEGFRYRDMETGTFISRDPLGHVDGPNVYCYVGQNPWTAFDPEGLHEAKISGEAVDKELRLATRDHRNAISRRDSIAASQERREAGVPSPYPYLEPSDDELANSREAAERDVWATGARMEFLQSIRFARQAFEARRGRDGYGSFGSMAAAEAQGLSWTQAAPYFEPTTGWLIPPAQSQAMLKYAELGIAVQTLWTPGVPAAGTLSPAGRALSGGGKARLVLPAANSAPALSLADDVATLKSIRRYSERLVLGKVTSSNASTMLEARDIQAAIANGNYRGAGTGFHSLNFKMARDAQSRGFLPNLNIDQSLATPGGFLPSRRPDYLFGGGGIYDIKPFRPSAGAYGNTRQFLDIHGQTGIMPAPLYYRLW